ncbi:hypothetical protein WV31_13270 [Magnetospirillum sp. ME-1]|uniref:glycosyltransferase n=1 Tax=Magnetospirillum sp. ME-1 TaxID=1639348 RepID=UPI000A17EEBE|nr:glycosyltransferase [Magnetospirillum sp. ME-1]ARJ66570.1 hypothetical protein WV31_13270 [Magnetospirillum sp. ME-1]
MSRQDDAGRSVLILTQPPYEGGVPAKTRILCRYLRDRGHRVSVAWYATFGHQADINVPLWRMPAGLRPGVREMECFGDFPGVAVGCLFPELEAPYYLPGRHWRRLIAAHDRHIAVGGPPLVGHLLAATGTPGLLWCASDVVADRRDRVAAMGPARRLIHDVVTLPWVLRQQAHTLASLPRVLGVSRYTVERLAAHGCPAGHLDRLPIPVDTDLFRPSTSPAPPAVLGFAARFEDPRKNIGLAFEALALLRRNGMDARLRLAGAEPSRETLGRVAALGLEGAVDFLGEIAHDQLAAFYQNLDLFVLPSHQEGLCIAGLEAMASGVPVISTRCGGPEDYVRDGETGFLVEAAPAALAGALARVAGDRALRRILSAGARRVAEAEFSLAAFGSGLARAWTSVWGDAP